MFSRFARLPLRRCLHTASGTARSAPRFTRTSKVVLVTSAAAAAYLSWNMSSEKSRVHMDSSPKLASKPPTPKLDASPPEHPSELLPEPGSLEPETANEEGKALENGQGETSQPQGAYNPETGEINWDCPCLGGMAHGPCGEQFKEAFSCFVYSEDEPKGVNCVDAFKKMQDCFREHPEIYADEIMKDDDEEPSASLDGESVSPGEGKGAGSEEVPVSEIPTPAKSHRTEALSSTSP